MGEEMRWSSEEPKVVLGEFCNEFRRVWKASEITNWLMIWTKKMDDEQFRSDIVQIRLTLRSLDNLITAAYMYVDRHASDQVVLPDFELTALANIIHDLKHDVSMAESFSGLIIQNQTNEEEILEDIPFWIRMLHRIDFLVKEAFPVILSHKDYLSELDLEKYHRLLQRGLELK